MFFFQAEDGIRDLVRSRGLGDVYKRQQFDADSCANRLPNAVFPPRFARSGPNDRRPRFVCCLLYTSDAADERSSVDLGGRRIIKKKKK